MWESNPIFFLKISMLDSSVIAMIHTHTHLHIYIYIFIIYILEIIIDQLGNHSDMVVIWVDEGNFPNYMINFDDAAALRFWSIPMLAQEALSRSGQVWFSSMTEEARPATARSR